MSNMSYCRFENTLRDFEDCAEALYQENQDELSNSERRYRDLLIAAAMDMALDYGYIIKRHVEETTGE